MTEYQKTMWARNIIDEVSTPDSPTWECDEVSSSDLPDTRNLVELSASNFPVGTKIEIYEPVCSKCGIVPYLGFDEGLTWLCECGVFIPDDSNIR